MATKAGTELGSHDGIGAFRTVRRLRSTPGHERLLALVGSDDREVVIERIALDGSHSSELALVRDRAEALKRMASPHLARILDAGLDGSDLVILSAYVPGQWLDELITAEARLKSHFLAIAVNLRIVLDVLAGLGTLHAQKGAPPKHGAVGPPNILVGVDGHARLVGALRSPKLKLAVPAGYAAPEILLGDGTADCRADLYSASVLLWEALSGKRLFDETDPQAVLARQLAGNLPRARVREPWAEPLADVAAKGLAVSPSDRYATAAEIASAIRLVAQARMAAATRVGRMVESLAEDALARRRVPAAVVVAASSNLSGLHRKEQLEPTETPTPPTPPTPTGHRPKAPDLLLAHSPSTEDHAPLTIVTPLDIDLSELAKQVRPTPPSAPPTARPSASPLAMPSAPAASASVRPPVATSESVYVDVSPPAPSVASTPVSIPEPFDPRTAPTEVRIRVPSVPERRRNFLPILIALLLGSVAIIAIAALRVRASAPAPSAQSERASAPLAPAPSPPVVEAPSTSATERARAAASVAPPKPPPAKRNEPPAHAEDRKPTRESKPAPTKKAEPKRPRGNYQPEGI